MSGYLIIGLIAINLLSGVCYAYDNPYDSAQGISGSSHRADQQSQGGIDYEHLNSPAESARNTAGTGFDTPRDSNIGWGNYAEQIPTPKPVTDCKATLEAWGNPPNCYCPCDTCRPVCTEPEKPKPSQSQGTTPHIKTPSGLSPSQQMQIQMMQGILQPFFHSLFKSIGDDIMSLSAPFHSSKQGYSIKQQEDIRRQEEEKRKAIEAWQKYLEEAERQAKQEMERKKKAGQDILSQVQIGSGFFGSFTIIGSKTSETQTQLASIDWENPRASVSSGHSQNITKSSKEQLLRAAYFSKMAETAILNQDIEAARFWASIAFEGDSISPRQIHYNPPKELVEAMDSKKAMEMNKKLTQYSRFFNEFLSRFDSLQNILIKMEEVRTKKEESEKKLKEIEDEINKIKIQNQTAQFPEEKTKANDLLAKAMALKKQAEADYHSALQEEQKLLQERQNIEKELSELKNKFTEGAE